MDYLELLKNMHKPHQPLEGLHLRFSQFFSQETLHFEKYHPTRNILHYKKGSHQISRKPQRNKVTRLHKKRENIMYSVSPMEIVLVQCENITKYNSDISTY